MYRIGPFCLEYPRIFRWLLLGKKISYKLFKSGGLCYELLPSNLMPNTTDCLCNPSDYMFKYGYQRSLSGGYEKEWRFDDKTQNVTCKVKGQLVEHFIGYIMAFDIQIYKLSEDSDTIDHIESDPNIK
ncbi:hypothetical protein MXB_1091, partial [Myxobolus squamalis]